MIDEPFGPAVPSVPLADSPLTFVVAQIRFPLVASYSGIGSCGQRHARSGLEPVRPSSSGLV